MAPEERISQRLLALERASQLRRYEPIPKTSEPVLCDARSNDYLGLARRLVSRETCSAHAGAGASRLVAGTCTEQAALEQALAEWLGTECALLFSSAFAANLGTLGALVGRDDTVLSDALNHASIIDGCRLSRGEVVVYPHCDLGGLAAELKRCGEERQCWVVTESYYGMDADSPDLPALRALCDRHGAGLIVDEAHALGVFGPTGRGLCAAAGVQADVIVGGMGKAIGTQGGFVACSRTYAEWLWNRARPFVFSTGASPVLCEVTRQQVAAVIAGDAQRRRLEQSTARLEALLLPAHVALPAGRHGPIFPILLGSEEDALEAADALLSRGILVQAIRPPTVPQGQSRLRVVLRADMEDAEVDALGQALVAVCGRTGPHARANGVPIVRGGAGPEWGDALSDPAGRDAPAEAATRRPGATTRIQGLEAAQLGARATDPRFAEAAAAAASVPPRGSERRTGATLASGRGLDDLGLGWRASRGAISAAGSGEELFAAPGAGRVSSGSPRWVVLGTGTEVGKTFVAVSLVSAYAACGVAVAGLKPIETGVGQSDALSDAARLERASFHVKHPTPHPLYAFRDPVTPALAARRAGTAIDLGRVAGWLDSVAPVAEPGAAPRAWAPPPRIVETAGGVFSPIARGQTNFTLAQLLEPAVWLLVAPDRLGVLHELGSTLSAMESRGRLPDWIVLNAPQHPDASTGHNAHELREMGVSLPILQLSWGDAGPLSALLGPAGDVVPGDAPAPPAL